MSATQSPKTLSPQKARQGVKGRPVLVVLVVSLAMVFAVWAILEFWGQSIAPETSVNAPAANATGNVSPGARLL